ncbi:hypothetical protein ACWGJP_05700 [Microbacterium sp. NPDC055903]
MSQQVMPVERVFRQHPLRALLSAVVIAVVLDALALLIIPQVLPDTIYTSGRRIIVFGAMAVITVVVLVVMLWLRNVQVRVSHESVTVGRAGKWESFPRATTAFRTHITEHRTNGVRSGTTRSLIVRTAHGERTIALPGFTRSVFNELAATLNPLTPPTAVDPVEAARVRAGLPTTFEVDAAGERRAGNRFLVVAVIALVVAVVAILPLFAPDFPTGETAPLVMLSPLAAIVAVGFGIGGFQRLRLARRSTTRIVVGSLGLRIGEVDHPYAQLTRIWLTPPAYATKRITLESPSGRSIHLLESARVAIRPEYSQFAASLHAHVAERQGLLSFDLE